MTPTIFIVKFVQNELAYKKKDNIHLIERYAYVARYLFFNVTL